MPFLVGAHFEPPPESELVLGEVTGSFGFVAEHATKFEQSVLTCMDRLSPFKYVEFKIRCKRVEPGEPFMAMDKPHYDVTMDLDRSERPEEHQLWTTPPAPIFYTVSPELEVIKAPVPECHILNYGRFSLHQTPVVDRPTTRLLIRCTESDIVKPRNTVEGR